MSEVKKEEVVVKDTKKLEPTRQKVASKKETERDNLGGDLFGNRQKIPADIQKELDEKNLAARFVSIKVIQESGGYHPKGWVPYKLDNPRKNPIDGSVDPLFRVGDLVLAVKTQADHKRHLAHLASRSNSQALEQKKSIQEMRDKIRESRAEKHVSLLEGYEENDDEDGE